MAVLLYKAFYFWNIIKIEKERNNLTFEDFVAAMFMFGHSGLSNRPPEHKTHALVEEVTTPDKSSRIRRTEPEARVRPMRSSTYKIMVVKKTSGV